MSPWTPDSALYDLWNAFDTTNKTCGDVQAYLKRHLLAAYAAGVREHAAPHYQAVVEYPDLAPETQLEGGFSAENNGAQAGDVDLSTENIHRGAKYLRDHDKHYISAMLIALVRQRDELQTQISNYQPALSFNPNNRWYAVSKSPDIYHLAIFPVDRITRVRISWDGPNGKHHSDRKNVVAMFSNKQAAEDAVMKTRALSNKTPESILTILKSSVDYLSHWEG